MQFEDPSQKRLLSAINIVFDTQHHVLQRITIPPMCFRFTTASIRVADIINQLVLVDTYPAFSSVATRLSIAMSLGAMVCGDGSIVISFQQLEVLVTNCNIRALFEPLLVLLTYLKDKTCVHLAAQTDCTTE